VQQTEREMKFWFENATTINFPRFHFRTTGAETISSVACTHNNALLTTANCQPWHGLNPPPQQCQAVNSETVSASQGNNERYQDMSINCVVNTLGTNMGNTLIAWELEGEHIGSYGPNAYASIWIAPNNNSWVLLSKAVTKPKGQPEFDAWERDLIYHSSVVNPGQYQVNIFMNSFRVVHFEFIDSYDGWMMLGDVGGFAFFLLVLHTLTMIAFGLCFNKNSHFLENK
jgi:hypothetical protein